MTDAELMRASAAYPGGELWAVVACGRDRDSGRVVAVMTTRAAANGLVRRLVLSHRVAYAKVERVPPVLHVLRGEVRM